MVKTNKKPLLVAMLVVLLSAMLLVGGLTISNNKPQVDSTVKAEGTSATLSGYYESADGSTSNDKYYWYNLINYDITNLTITNKESYIPETYLEKVDVSQQNPETTADGLLHAYVFDNGQSGYDCVIYGNVDTIYAPENSSGLFNCSTLKTINFDCFDTSKVTSMTMMFAGVIVEMLDLSSFVTTQCTSMAGMFLACINLKEVNLSPFDTSNVEYMGEMFNSCISLTKLDLSHFNTSKVKRMADMFGNMALEYGMITKTMALEELDISKFVVSSSCDVNNMLTDLTNLKKLVAPAECNAEITLPKTMLDSETKTEYTSLSSSTNGKTLLCFELENIPNFTASQYQAGTSATLKQSWANGLNYNLNTLIVTNDHTKVPADYVLAYDVSQEQNKSIVAIVVQNGSKYDCIIYGQVETIYAPQNSSFMFSAMAPACNSLTSIIFEDFDTSNVTDFSGIFFIYSWDFLIMELNGEGANLDKNSPTLYQDMYLCIFGSEFVSQDGDDTNDEQEAKSAINNMAKQELGTELGEGLSYIDASTFEISSTATTEMMMSSIPQTLKAPKKCDQDISFGGALMYAENSETAYTSLSSSTNGLTLVSTPNSSANNSGSLTPATGFDTTDLIITTTLGLTLLVLFAVAFNKTKKRYIKR